MPSSLVNRYAVYIQLDRGSKVAKAISRHASFLVAVESCLAAYRETGHMGFRIEDPRRHREFQLDRTLLLRVLLLKAQNEPLYFDVMNRLDHSGAQADLESYLAGHAI